MTIDLEKLAALAAKDVPTVGDARSVFLVLPELLRLARVGQAYMRYMAAKPAEDIEEEAALDDAYRAAIAATKPPPADEHRHRLGETCPPVKLRGCPVPGCTWNETPLTAEEMGDA